MALNLPKIISSAVKTADKITKSVQVEVQHHAWESNDRWGKPVYADPIPRRAIYDSKQESKFDTATGKVIQTKGKLTFLEPIPPNGATGRIEPIDNRDLLILPDGTTGPIFKPEGLLNPDINRPFLIELWIGA